MSARKCPVSRVCIWLEELQPKIRKPPVELSRQPWTRGKPANEKGILRTDPQTCEPRDPKLTNRVHGKNFCEVLPDGIRRGLNGWFEKLRYLFPMQREGCKRTYLGR